MQFTSQSPTAGHDWLAAVLEANSTRPAAALWSTPTLRLFTNSIVLAPSLNYAAFTEATFNGYLAVALTVSAPINTPNSGLGVLANGLFIAGSAIAPGQTCYGYLVGDAGGTTWYLAELFPTPIPFATPGDFLDLTFIASLAAILPTGF